jgi:hypothetical protein
MAKKGPLPVNPDEFMAYAHAVLSTYKYEIMIEAGDDNVYNLPVPFNGYGIITRCGSRYIFRGKAIAIHITYNPPKLATYLLSDHQFPPIMNRPTGFACTHNLVDETFISSNNELEIKTQIQEYLKKYFGE